MNVATVSSTSVSSSTVIAPVSSQERGITTDLIARLKSNFENNAVRCLAQGTVTENGYASAAMDRNVVQRVHNLFTHTVTKETSVTNQKASGRCWLFAGLNVMRDAMIKMYGMKRFEFSQAYLFFWDKFEKSNFYLNNIIATADREWDDRLIHHLNTDIVSDGGQWDMFVNLVQKYGVIPKECMQETYASSSSRMMAKNLKKLLRSFAVELRKMHGEQVGQTAIQARKEEMLQDIYNLLAVHLGTPPNEFDWKWKDKGDKVHKEENLTPQTFFDKLVPYNPADRVCLIHDPRKNHPYGQHYTVEYLGNVTGGKPVSYINLPVAELKKYTQKMIDTNEPVWFGCDVGQDFSRKKGILDTNLFRPERVYGTKPKITKEERLLSGDSLMTHAMVLRAYDTKKGSGSSEEHSTHWRVENSWGEDSGNKGFLCMNDQWFDEWVYEVAIEKAFLSPEHLAILDQEATVLPPWDPMGSLA